MIFIMATVSTMWGYSLTMAIGLVVIILYACVAYRVKREDAMAD